MLQQQQPQRWWHPIIKTLASKRPVVWVISRSLHYVDRAVIKVTGGKHSAGTFLSGLLIVTVTTTGAKSGQPRSVPLIALPNGEKLVFIASNWGQKALPAWYHNMRAYPEVTISQNGWEQRYTAHEAAGQERDKYWNLAVEAYAGYAAYRQRAGNRDLPVMVCTPDKPLDG